MTVPLMLETAVKEEISSQQEDHNRDSMILYKSYTEDSSDGELEPGLQRTQGTGPRTGPSVLWPRVQLLLHTGDLALTCTEPLEGAWKPVQGLWGSPGVHRGPEKPLSHKELCSTCDVCGKKSSSIKRMEIHKRVHTGAVPLRVLQTGLLQHCTDPKRHTGVT
ncbi:hypothetical protein GBF38_010568 [Nibea albiflora]|uniref:Uncharacterized protein n=1 Tax=Nibea albiflora TaxID=240163 RepID=A0ACB7ERE4_NIBAL|nr:hypothetical protein GBF38_010568 [Nibea albiflora]